MSKEWIDKCHFYLKEGRISLSSEKSPNGWLIEVCEWSQDNDHRWVIATVSIEEEPTIQLIRTRTFETKHRLNINIDHFLELAYKTALRLFEESPEKWR